MGDFFTRSRYHLGAQSALATLIISQPLASDIPRLSLVSGFLVLGFFLSLRTVT